MHTDAILLDVWKCSKASNSKAHGGQSPRRQGMGPRGIQLPPHPLPWQKGVLERVGASVDESNSRTLQPNETPGTLEIDAGEVR